MAARHAVVGFQQHGAGPDPAGEPHAVPARAHDLRRGGRARTLGGEVRLGIQEERRGGRGLVDGPP
eukprot:10839060-Alexandrium_andersonii.AAC.1